MVVLEKSEAGSRCITNGIFAEGRPNLGGTTDATANSVRPIRDERFLFDIRRNHAYKYFSSALKEYLFTEHVNNCIR